MIRNAASRKSCRRRLALFILSALAGVDVQVADAANTPVKVFILSGQSNMVGAGKVDGGSSRWGSEFIDPVVSVYKGAYNPKADYDVLEPAVEVRELHARAVRDSVQPSPVTQMR